MENYKRTRSLNPYRPSGAQAHDFNMPRQPPAESHRCIVKIDFPWHGKDEAVNKIERMADCQYLVGTTSYAANGRLYAHKGQNGRPIKMLVGSDPSPHFARRWLLRDRASDEWEPGWDGARLTLDQAWAKELMARKLSITKGHNQGNREPRRYRVRICPEFEVAQRLAKGPYLDQFIREYMVRVQADLKRELFWIGAGHYKPRRMPDSLDALERERWPKKPMCHGHLSWRGVDASGEAVYIEAPYVQRGLEHRARQLLMEMFPVAQGARHAC
jgi:hypothetical protein